jgi:two-component system chemotaxis sensor kinase CheA
VDISFDLEPGDDRLFADESLEQIEAIERGLLELERGEAEPSTVNEVFRAAHTLKGSAATIGHRRMAALTHAMEDIFGGLRSGTIASVAPFADILLSTLDVLRALVDEVFAGHTLTDRPDELTAALRAALDAGNGASGTAPATTSSGPSTTTTLADGPSTPEALSPMLARLFAEAPTGDEPRTVVTATIDPSCEWSAVRLLQLLMEAGESDRLRNSVPSQAEIEAGASDLTLVMLVAGQIEELDDLVRRLGTVDDVVDVSTRPSRVPTDEPVDAADSAEAARDRPRTVQQTIRIDVSRLDELMNLVGELVVQKTRLQRQASQLVGTLGVDDALAREAEEGAQQFSRIASQLQDQVTGLRMLPIDTVFSRFPRVVRDVSAKLGKDVALVVDGKETELDRSVLEEVGDPLGHLVRNSLDHGIEPPDARVAAGKPAQGRLGLSARHADGMIVITVEDDGAGMDPNMLRRKAVEKDLMTAEAAAALTDAEALKIIFAPGFSTAAKITDVSGRGVGMDVVRTNIERLGGRVDVASVVGAGTRISLSLPLTLAIVGAMLVRSADRVCALPLVGVVETLRIKPESISWVRGRPVIVLRDRVVPIEVLDAALGDPARPLTPGPRGFINIVVVRSRDSELGLAVDAFVGEQEIVLKSMTTFTTRLVGISGGTILADGSVALVVDIGAVLERTSRALAAA